MEVWVHGSTAIYHPSDERNVGLDGTGASFRPGIPENHYPKVVDCIYNFQWPLIETDLPRSGLALDAVLVRIRTYYQSTDEQPTGLVWVQVNDRNRPVMRELRKGEDPLTSPGLFRTLRVEAPRPTTPYGLDPSSVSSSIAVSLRIEGPSLAIVSGVGLALRPSVSYYSYSGGVGDQAEQIVVPPSMDAAEFEAQIADDLADPQPFVPARS